jgi:hypothetical protein
VKCINVKISHYIAMLIKNVKIKNKPHKTGDYINPTHLNGINEYREFFLETQASRLEEGFRMYQGGPI